MEENINIYLNINKELSHTNVTIETNDKTTGNDIYNHLEQFTIPTKKLNIKTQNGIYMIDKENIIFAEIFDKKITIQTTEETLETRLPLNTLYESLNHQTFIQISKSSIINIDYIKKIDPSFSGNFFATLKNGEKVSISRRYVKNLSKALGL